MAGSHIALTVGGQMVEKGIVLSELHLEFLTKRKISQKTAELGRVYSVKRLPNGDHEPSPDGDVLAFPFVHCDKIVNTKYRGPRKRFYQSGGGEKVFWNGDCLNDPTVQDGTNPVVIVEGEMDALSFIEAGYPFVVSVPNGASVSLRTSEGRDIDPEQDIAFSYLLKSWDQLKNLNCVIIATDNDEAGKKLAEELVRRIGRARCKFVTFPEKCKDANDVLIAHGSDGVKRLLTEARPYPVSGLYTYFGLPIEPDLVPVSTGWPCLDPYINLFYPAVLTITGRANLGKSTFANQLVAQLAYDHGWGCALASFEMRIKPFVTNTLKETYIQRAGTTDGWEEWIDKKFCFIAPEPSDEDDSFDVEWLIERARTAVIRYGIRVLLVDPWNEIEHASKKGENGTDYIGRAYRAFKRFGRQHEVLVIVVAHPTKGSVQNKDPDRLDLYDIADSANFSNKSDFGVTIARIENSYQSHVVVHKLRYERETGLKGRTMLEYNPNTRLFEGWSG